MKKRNSYNFKKFLNLADIVIREDDAINFINKILIYNDRLNIKNIPINYIGFEMILDNYTNGLPEEELIKNVIPFIISHYDNPHQINYIKNHLDVNNFNIYGSSYVEIIQYINKMLDNSDID